MRPLVIQYDLSSASEFDYRPLIDELHKFGAVRATKSVWFVASSAKPVAVRDHFLRYMHADDMISVNTLAVGGGYATQNLSGAALAWLKEYTQAKEKVR